MRYRYHLATCVRDLKAGGDNQIKIFREEEGGNPDAPSFSVHASIKDAHKEDVNTIAWSPTEGLLASGSDDGVVALWKVE